ncbi:MAG: hypothetical protein GXY28_00825 [Bacteriovoracaceae bacterium]|nr:hypothetical protein [Bacteriovoracaceae bacterium]
MEAAKKIIFECACGTISDLSCDGCGAPVCGSCGTRQISSFDPLNIEVRHYCLHCSQDAGKNVWGNLYWKELVSLYS